MIMIEFHRSGQRFHRSAFDSLIHLNLTIRAVQSIYSETQLTCRNAEPKLWLPHAVQSGNKPSPVHWKNRRHAINTHDLHVKLCYRVV